jgi:hypothetical protein
MKSLQSTSIGFLHQIFRLVMIACLPTREVVQLPQQGHSQLLEKLRVVLFLFAIPAKCHFQSRSLAGSAEPTG